MTYPSFVIVGCPKTATGSVAGWLRGHPECGAAAAKETFYLVDPGFGGSGPRYAQRGLEGYAELFASVAERPIRFEATTHYYYQDTAFEVLRDLPTQPKVALFVRQPSDRFRSWFGFNLNHLANVRPDLTFARTVDLILDGHPEELRSFCRNETTYRTLAEGVRHGVYVDYVERWATLGDRFRVFVTEDLHRDDRAFMRGLANWLGIDPTPFEGGPLAKRNTAYDVRSRRLHRFARNVARTIPFPGRIRKGLGSVYRRLQNRPSSPTGAADLEALARLDEHYREPNARLADVLGRPDLPALWARDRTSR